MKKKHLVVPETMHLLPGLHNPTAEYNIFLKFAGRLCTFFLAYYHSLTLGGCIGKLLGKEF